MGHLPDPHLRHWKSGEQLYAESLNWNFGVLLGLIETAAALALRPDPAGVEALERSAQAEGRIARLEQREASTEREKGERQYATLAAFGHMQRQVQQISGPLRQAAAALQADLGVARTLQGGVEERVAALEASPPPPAPSVPAFQQLQAELQQARAEAHMAAQQLAGMRAELATLRKLVLDPDRGTNKREYATLAALGHVLRRIAKLEAQG